MSRHPFSRRKRRRMRKGRRKFTPTYELIDGKTGAFRVRWGPRDFRLPSMKELQKSLQKSSGAPLGRRHPWDKRRSTVSKGVYRTPEQISQWHIRKRLDELLDNPPSGWAEFAPDALGGGAGPR
jgi:hypothetical protein